MNAAEILQEGTVGVDAAVRFSGLGRTVIYGLMSRGELPFAKVGSRRLIPLAALKAVLARGLVGGQGDLTQNAEVLAPSTSLPANTRTTRTR
jgi:excisionase family DNA binding protein